MNKDLQKLYDRIEIQRREVFDQINSLSFEELNRKPSSGKWSISEIISHLIVAEQLSVNYIKKKIQGVEQVEDTGLWEEIKMIILKASQRIEGLKFQAPRYILENTTVHSEVNQLMTEWNRTREDLQQVLEKIQDKHLKRKIYKHARMGYLNVGHALQFFREHVIHHRPQIRRLMK